VSNAVDGAGKILDHAIYHWSWLAALAQKLRNCGDGIDDDSTLVSQYDKPKFLSFFLPQYSIKETHGIH